MSGHLVGLPWLLKVAIYRMPRHFGFVVRALHDRAAERMFDA